LYTRNKEELIQAFYSDVNLILYHGSTGRYAAFYLTTVSLLLRRPILPDILIGSPIPLGLRFGKNPQLSIQLIQGEKVLEETRAAAADENGIWEIKSPLNLYARKSRDLFSITNGVVGPTPISHSRSPSWPIPKIAKGDWSRR
jgi:hypothetical protein